MEKSEIERFDEMGELQFWRENIVHFRNRVANSKTPAELQTNLKTLEECRKSNKLAEKLLLVVLLCILLFTVGCETVSGFGRDVTNLSDGWMEKQARNRNR